jgi:hypothetical protein
LFDNAQPELADIIGVVRAGTSEIFVAEIRHFAKKKVPSNMVKGTFWKNSKKICHNLRKKRVMK